MYQAYNQSKEVTADGIRQKLLLFGTQTRKAAVEI